MAGIDGIIFEDDSKPIIKYDQVYKPNPLVCPGETYPSFSAMMAACGERLEKASLKADKDDVPFIPYKCDCVLKPEFRTAFTED